MSLRTSSGAKMNKHVRKEKNNKEKEELIAQERNTFKNHFIKKQ